MSEKLRYVTDEHGQRVGVLLDLEEYGQITGHSSTDPDLLVGLSEAELQALAESALAPSAQARLEDLLARNAEGKLAPEESAELDRLLEQADQLNLLKTRARYTLKHQESMATAA